MSANLSTRTLLVVPVLLLGVCWAADTARADSLYPSLAGLGTQTVSAPDDVTLLAPVQLTPQERIFRIPYPDSAFVLRRKERVEYFSEVFRVGVASGVVWPLITQEAGYEFGWWTRLTGHKEVDILGMGFFRTMLEASVEIGQSTSNPDDQSWRIVSNLYFFKLRVLADFLTESPHDFYIYGGIGLGVERARGHLLGPGGFEKVKEVNFSPLLEAGGGLSLAISRTFMLDVRVATTWPVTSSNVLLYLNVEAGVFFLFL